MDWKRNDIHRIVVLDVYLHYVTSDPLRMRTWGYGYIQALGIRTRYFNTADL